MRFSAKKTVLGATGFLSAGVLAVAAGYVWLANRHYEDYRLELVTAAGESLDIVDRAPSVEDLPSELEALLLPRDGAEDGAVLAYARPLDLGLPRHAVEAIFRAEEEAGDVNLPAPRSEVMSAVESSTDLDRYVRAAAGREWRALEIGSAGSPRPGTNSIGDMAWPPHWQVEDAGLALILRARIRLERGDRAAALEDLRAAMSLGEHMARREPTANGVLTGWNLMVRGAEGLAAHADATGDAELARRADRVRTALGSRRNLYRYGLFSIAIHMPEQGLSVAQDESLGVGHRIEGLLGYTVGELWHGTPVLLGMSDDVESTLQRFVSGGDPDLSRVAHTLLTTLGERRFWNANRASRELEWGELPELGARF